MPDALDPDEIIEAAETAEGQRIVLTASAWDHISFEHPEWKFGFDADPETAISTRKALMDRAATDKIKLIGFHYAYPGVGFAEKKDSAYAFVKA